MESSIIKVAIADDHTMFRFAVKWLLNKTGNFSVVTEAGDGKELIAKIQGGIIPQIVLLDLNMPDLDGYETAKLLNSNFPDINVIMLTMYHTEQMMIRLLNAGVRGFLRKDVDPGELPTALQNVMKYGYHHTNNTTGRIVNLFRKNEGYATLEKSMISETEYRFLRLACSDLTYKEIAKEMHLSARAVDNIRDTLFAKLEVKSRVGLVMYAIRHGIKTF